MVKEVKARVITTEDVVRLKEENFKKTEKPLLKPLLQSCRQYSQTTQ
jgi:hypothetical protein